MLTVRCMVLVLQLNVDLERIAKIGCEDRDLVLLRDILTPGQERQELLQVFGHCARATEADEFTECWTGWVAQSVDGRT